MENIETVQSPDEIMWFLSWRDFARDSEDEIRWDEWDCLWRLPVMTATKNGGRRSRSFGAATSRS